MIWIALSLATVAAAYVLACRLTGENLASTWWDEWRLSRTPLRSLDEACVARRTGSGPVVTLTTIPSRIDALEPTLKSLLRQTAAPKQIRLCLPAWSEREQRAYLVPEWLKALACVTLAPCSDEGPATKFLSTLQSLPAGQEVVVLDDDRIYHPRLLEELAALAARHPEEAISCAGWSAPEDLIDRPTTLAARLRGAPYVPVRANLLRRPRRVDIVQGVHAYLVRPRFFDLAALADFSGAPPAVRYVDDVWLSAHCAVPRVVHPLRLPFTDYKPWSRRRLFDATSLGGNVNRAPDPACRGNSIALRYFAARWKSPGRGGGA